MINRVSALIFLLLVACSLGCSKSDRPPIGEVVGSVTLDGKPLSGAWVMFHPEGGRCVGGVTDQQGKYELLYLDNVKGAKVGQHKVVISTVMAASDTASGMPAGERVPRPYNNLQTTTLEASVEPRKNIIDFDLESPKPGAR